jgi:threonine synthase
MSDAMPYFGVLHRYRHLLDIPAHTAPVTLLEGNTLLIPMPRLAEELGGGFELWVKFEGLNPTCSFKDRGMTVAISEAVGRGVKSVICASTGNTAASAAAYAARAGLRSIVLIPQGKVAAGKLAGAVAYGAQVVQVEGSFDDALSLVVEITQKHPIALVNSLNPYRLEGQKTAAFGFAICSSQPRIGCAHRGQRREHHLLLMGFNNLTGRNDRSAAILVCRRPGRPRSSWATR